MLNFSVGKKSRCSARAILSFEIFTNSLSVIKIREVFRIYIIFDATEKRFDGVYFTKNPKRKSVSKKISGI